MLYDKVTFVCRQLIKILRILVPGCFTAEVYLFSFANRAQRCLLNIEIFHTVNMVRSANTFV